MNWVAIVKRRQLTWTLTGLRLLQGERWEGTSDRPSARVVFSFVTCRGRWATNSSFLDRHNSSPKHSFLQPGQRPLASGDVEAAFVDRATHDVPDKAPQRSIDPPEAFPPPCSRGPIGLVLLRVGRWTTVLCAEC